MLLPHISYEGRLLKPRRQRNPHPQQQLHRSPPGYFPSILGGMDNQASADNSTVSGGALNLASNLYASVSAGKENKATGEGPPSAAAGKPPAPFPR